MDFNNYKFRAHNVGHIMSGVPKPLTEKQAETFTAYSERKSGIGKPLTDKQTAVWGDLYSKKNAKCELTDGAKKYLEKLFWSEISGRSKSISAKYLDKGIRCEEKSFTLHSEVTNKLFLKNEERKENEFFSGECDNAQNKVIRDIKTSWEYDTFPLTDDRIMTSGYVWQGDVYMDLWNFKKFELIYCLVDTPFGLINDDIRRLDWKHDVLDGNGDVREQHIPLIVEHVSSHIYTNIGLETFCQQSSNIKIEWFEGVFIEIPQEVRVKIFKHEYCEIRNQQLKQMVVLARSYMNSLLEELGESVSKFNITRKSA